MLMESDSYVIVTSHLLNIAVLHRHVHMLDLQLPTQLDSSTFNVIAQMLAPANESLHKCVVCQKRFSLHSHLKTHMLIHTGGRRHSCDICQEVFCLLSVAVLRYSGWWKATRTWLSQAIYGRLQCYTHTGIYNTDSQLCSQLEWNTLC